MRSDSFRFKLMMLYFWTIVIPTVIIVFFLPNFFQKLLLHQTTQYTESTAAAFTKNIESYLNELERLTLTPYFDSDIMKALKFKAKQDPIAQLSPLEKLKMDEVLNEKFHNFIRMSRKDISGTTLVTSDGSIYAKSTGLTAPVNNYPFSSTEWYRKALAAEGSAVFIGSHKQDYLKQPLETDVFSVARIIRDPDTELKLAFIIADADTGVLRNLIQDFQFNVNATIAVLDDNQQVVYSTAPLSPLMSKSVGESSVSIVEDEKTYTVIRRDIGTAHWKLVFFAKFRNYLSAKVVVHYRGLFAVCGLFLTVIVFFLLSKWIIRPFKEIIWTMKKVEIGNLQTRLQVRGTDEVAQIGLAFNRMINQVEELIVREYQAKFNQQQAEYRSLQAQIQPHFLYNILNGFIGLNRIGEHEKLEESIIHLSKMLRYILAQRDWTCVKDECDFLAWYCQLQQLRFQDRLQYHIRYDTESMSVPIPKLLLQPLVENSIIHGIEPLNQQRELNVDVHVMNNHTLSISVADNGAGFDASKAGKSVGLTNVKERLQLAYPEGEFVLDSRIGEGTRIHIRIPIKEAFN